MFYRAQEIVEKFKEIDADGSGKLDVEEAQRGLKSLQTATGRTLVEKEVEFFIKSTSGEDGLIDLGAFTNLLYRLKLYNAPPPKWNNFWESRYNISIYERNFIYLFIIWVYFSCIAFLLKMSGKCLAHWLVVFIFYFLFFFFFFAS